MKHKHRWFVSCTCDSTALEPSDDCRLHCNGEWPRKCDDCGQFLSYRWMRNKDRVQLSKEAK